MSKRALARRKPVDLATAVEGIYAGLGLDRDVLLTAVGQALLEALSATRATRQGVEPDHNSRLVAARMVLDLERAGHPSAGAPTGPLIGSLTLMPPPPPPVVTGSLLTPTPVVIEAEVDTRS